MNSVDTCSVSVDDIQGGALTAPTEAGLSAEAPKHLEAERLDVPSGRASSRPACRFPAISPSSATTTTAAVALTSVRRPAKRMGRVAASLLIEETGEDADHHSHQQIVLQPELVVRSSSVQARAA